MSYQEDLAYIHHVGFSDLARQSAAWIVRTLRKAHVHDGVVVELGCGSGILLSALSAAGYQAVGVDAAPAMLEIASRIAPGATLQQASLYEFEIPPCRAIIAMGEALNYVAGPDMEPPVERLLSKAAAALADGGLLLFDVIVAGRKRIKPYRTWGAGADWAALVDVSPHPKGRDIQREITTFRLVNGTYRRGFEEHWVHLFSPTVLARRIEAAGFAVRTASSYGPVRLAPGRRLFYCVRPAT